MVKLKENIGRRVLKRQKKGKDRDIRVHNFETAGSAVLLFDTAEPDAFSVIDAFRKHTEAQGIKCSVFGFVPQKEIPQEMLFRKNYLFITKSDLTWYLKPKGEVVEAFFSHDPDLLVDFTRDVPLELQFLVQLSTARFKIGCYTEGENDYDLMINLTERTDIGYLADQIKHYVSMLNPAN